MSQSIAKNTAFITIAYIGQKIISFVYFTLIARQIGATSTGKYFFALSFTTIFVVFIDLGLNQVLIREAARFKDKAQNYFSTVLWAKFFLALLTYLAAIIVINLMGYPTEIKQLVYLSAITMVFDSIHLSIYGVIRAVGSLKYEAIGIIGSQFITLVLGSAFLYAGWPLIFLILAFTIPSILNVCYAGIVLIKKYHIKLRPQFDQDILKMFLKIAAPFALAAIFARLYSYFDSVLLSKLVGDKAVGWYSIAYKITFAFQFIPMALIAAVYPRFSEFFVNDKNRLAYIFERSFKYLLIIVLPISLGLIILAKNIVLSIYSIDFLNSILPLQILLLGLVFSFLSFPVGALLNACNKQRTQTTIVFIVLVVNVVLNILLIPHYTVVGAAISATIGNALLTIIGYYFTKKLAKISHWFILKSFLQTLISAIIMGLVVWQVNLHWHYLMAITTGGLTYVVCLFLFKAVDRGQIKEAITLIKK